MEKQELNSIVKEFQDKFEQSIVIVLDKDGRACISMNCTAHFAGDTLKDLIRENPSVGKAMSKAMIGDLIDDFAKSNVLEDVLKSLKEDIEEKKSEDKLN